MDFQQRFYYWKSKYVQIQIKNPTIYDVNLLLFIIIYTYLGFQRVAVCPQMKIDVVRGRWAARRTRGRGVVGSVRTITIV